MNTEKLSNEAQTPALNKGAVSSRYRVNVLHGGKERWKYCRTIKRAKHLQESALLIEPEGIETNFFIACL